MLKVLATALTLGLLINPAHSGEIETKSTAGINKSYFDTTADAREDFYRFANGTWLDTVNIPADKSIFSSFSELSDLNDDRIKAIIEEAAATTAKAGTPAQQIGDFYKSYMDTERLNQLGVSPLKAEFDRIEAVANVDDIYKLMAHYTMINVPVPMGVGVGVDAKDAMHYAVYVSQSGLSLPDRDYYLDDSDKMAQLRKAFQAHLVRMFTLLKRANPEADAMVVFNIEKRMAESQWTRVATRDTDKSYNKYNREELAKFAPGFDWNGFFDGMMSKTEPLIVRQPSYVKGFAEMFPTVPLQDWKTYFTWRLINNFAGLLSDDFQQADFDFFGKTLSGTQEQQPRWKRAVGAENEILGELVGNLYVQKHFKPEAKQRMKELVENLKAAFSERLNQLPWMSDTTKQEAQKKLSMFNAKIGYPDKWRDYSDLRIAADDLVGNYIRAKEVESRRDLAHLGQPIDKDEWSMTPQTVNAYYSSTRNEIVFPAAILQPPFFDLGADMAANYGAIGAVIGHEITHGFDDQGRKSDGSGNLRDWWTEQDRKEFEKRADMMVQQYGEFKPLPDVAVNGRLTLGENIADLGGLTMAYYAYKRSLKGKPSPVIDGFSGEQRLFISWAQSWRRKYREEALRNRLATDSHSPGFCRAIGPVSNMPEFYEAFGVKPGDKMYRDETVRVRIW